MRTLFPSTDERRAALVGIVLVVFSVLLVGLRVVSISRIEYSGSVTFKLYFIGESNEFMGLLLIGAALLLVTFCKRPTTGVWLALVAIVVVGTVATVAALFSVGYIVVTAWDSISENPGYVVGTMAGPLMAVLLMAGAAWVARSGIGARSTPEPFSSPAE